MLRKAIILAGGKGTRLDSVSGGIPKPLIEVCGKPFIEYVLEHGIAQGIDHFILAVSYKWNLFMDNYSTNFKDKLISYSVEETPLGTGGAVKKAFLDFDLNESYVINSDTYFKANYNKLYDTFKAHNADCGMMIKEIADTSRYGSIEIDDSNRLTTFKEKSIKSKGYINGGIYVIKKDTFDKIDSGNKFSLESDLFENYVKELNIIAYKSKNKFIDIGVPEDLLKAESLIIND
tara:strand:- start:190 stop:888 length:699 start_codon:yes stop_codon:yes gene_type:complete